MKGLLNMKKQITSGLLAAVTVLGMAAAPAQSVIPALQTAIVASAADKTYGDLYYQTDGKQVIITGCKSGSKLITIPEKIDGLPVTAIDSSAFYNSDVVSVTISEGVKSIGDQAFFLASDLTTIKLPSTLETIGENCFQETSITEVEISDKVKTIPQFAFANCKKLSSVKIGKNVAVIGWCAFAGDSSLTSVELPDSLKTVGKEAFHRCTSVSRIDVPYSVQTIGDEAFGFKNDGIIPELQDNFTLGVWKGTVSEKYANDNGIKKAYLNTSISGATVTLSKNSYVYSGKSLVPSVTVKLGSKTLRKGSDYKVSIRNNTNCGKATVTVTGINKYMNSKVANFIIKPAKVTSKKLVSAKTKTVKLTWAKAGGNVDGYQILTATNKKFTAAKKTTWVKKGTTTAKTIKGLKKGKVYYAKIRAFKTIDGKKQFGDWSAVKKAKTK